MNAVLTALPNEAGRRPIVSIVDGEPMADSRDVAAYFDRNHKDVLRSIATLGCSSDFRERNFAAFKIKDLTGESTSHVMMTKDGFTFLAMGFTGMKAAGFKERFIAQFNAMEAELRARPVVDPTKALNDPTTLRTLLLASADREIALQGQVQEMQPQVQALERIAVSDGSMCITDAAKTLQVSPKALFRYLQTHLVSGDLEHKTNTVLRADGSEKTATQVRVTPKGLTKLAKLLPPAASAV